MGSFVLFFKGRRVRWGRFEEESCFLSTFHLLEDEDEGRGEDREKRKERFFIILVESSWVEEEEEDAGTGGWGEWLFVIESVG